jgi:hypothetical protein
MPTHYSKIESKHVIVHDLVRRTKEKSLGLDGLVVGGKGHDRDHVTLSNKVSCGAIHDDLAGTFLALNDVGLEAGSIGDGSDEDLLSDPEICGTQQVRGDANAAFIVHIGIRNGGAVELGFEESSEHRSECVPCGEFQVFSFQFSDILG